MRIIIVGRSASSVIPYAKYNLVTKLGETSRFPYLGYGILFHYRLIVGQKSKVRELKGTREMLDEFHRVNFEHEISMGDCETRRETKRGALFALGLRSVQLMLRSCYSWLIYCTRLMRLIISRLHKIRLLTRYRILKLLEERISLALMKVNY